MTTTDPSVESTIEPPLGTATVQALREVIFGPHIALHARVREVVVGLSDRPCSDLTYSQEAEAAPDLLRAAIAALGHPAHEIATDTQLRGALCDWAQIAAPRLLPVLTGHFDLAIGAILSLGDGSDYQRRCLAALDTGAALGVLMITELGGTNGADQQTTATWDRSADGFWLVTPAPTAIKYMPNVADTAVPKTAVVTARLLVDGQDEGVLPFLVELRTSTGLVDGARVVRLPDKASASMDHAMIRFDRVWLPRHALLGGDWARIGDDGRFECSLPPRNRFHRAISVLGNGRLDLANAAAAGARAGLAGLINYSRQRCPGSGVRMADRDAVQRDLVTGLAAVYATSVLGRRLRDLRAASTDPADPRQALWSMLAKPLLSNTALQVLIMCRQRAASQGALRINHLVDWIGNSSGIVTAEGENQIMQITAGKSPIDLTTLRLPDTPPELPWYIEMLAERERAISAGLRGGSHDAAGIALGPDSAAIELATATAERLAATALIIAAFDTRNTEARNLITATAAAYALHRIHAHGTWYAAHHMLPPDHAATLTEELRNHHALLADNLKTMVDAFDIPDLPGPIFRENYIKAWQDYADWSDSTFRL
jgi:acyl-CoA oxidase